MLHPVTQDLCLWAPLTFSFSSPLGCVVKPLNCPGSLRLFEHTLPYLNPAPGLCTILFRCLLFPYFLRQWPLMSWTHVCFSLTILFSLVWGPVFNLLQTEFHGEQGPPLP